MKQNKETFRIFLGTYLKDHSCLNHYDALKNLWKEELRWVAKENLHFTWKFLGNITQHRINRIIKGLNHCTIAFKPSILVFDSIEIWPKPSTPRQLIWKGRDLTNNILENFKLLDKTLSNIGFSPEKRTLKPHITLARFKAKEKPIQPIKLPAGFMLPSVQLPVQSISIIKSVLKPSGPEYSVIEELFLPG